MNTRVNKYLAELIVSGSITALDAKALSQLSSGSIASIQAISALPPDVAAQVREAFRQGTRWAFISLIPWAVVAFAASLFLSRLDESDFNPQAEVSESKAVLPELDGVETPDVVSEKRQLEV